EVSNESDDGTIGNYQRMQMFGTLWMASALERIAELRGADIPELMDMPVRAVIEPESDLIHHESRRFRVKGYSIIQADEWHYCGTAIEDAPQNQMPARAYGHP